MAGMKAADTQLAATEKAIDDARRAMAGLNTDLRDMELPERAVAQVKGNLKIIDSALVSTMDTVSDVRSKMSDLYVPQSAVAQNALASRQEVDQINDIRNAAVEAKVALDLVGRARGEYGGSGMPMGVGRARSSLGTFLPPTSQDLIWNGSAWQQVTRPNRIFTAGGAPAGGGVPPGREMVPYNPANLLLQNRIFAQDAQYAERIRRDVGSFGKGPLPPNPILRMSQVGGGDVAGAVRYLRSRGIDPNDPSHNFMGGLLGLIGGRGGDNQPGFLQAMGWGGGGGIPVPWMFGFGRGGFGGRGRRLFPGMARFGSLGGLAGFGAERALTSTLGIAGSGVGALLGGGLLAGGALATTAVGMGTDLAGTGQALHGITTTAQAMDKLDVAIATYGKNSRQAVTAQKQLNAAMAEFDPRVRKAYMAAAQTSVAFGDMFHKLTAPAAKTGADIIRQIMLVGEKFLPTIGKFAAENTKIIQKGLQPLFSWLQQAGPQGGLGIFTDLEKIFQKRLPQSIHMLTQAFELFMKVLDAAAQHTGGLIKGLDHFFTKWNSPQNWGQVHHVVESLIHMFDVWLNLFKQIGGALFAVFKPAVGFGTQFIGMLADIIGKIRTWLNLTTTQAALHSLFEAHLAQIKALFGLLNVLLPVLEQTALAFIKVEAAVSQVVAGALRVFVWMINQILRIPLAKTLLGWVFALYLMRSALRSVTVMMGLNSGAGLLGSILGVGRATTATTGLFYGMAGAETTAAGATTGLAATITGTLFPALTALATRFGPMLGLIGAGALGAAMAFTEPSASAKQSIKDLGLKSVGNGVYWSKNTGYVTVSQSGAVTPTTLSGAATHPTRGGGGAPGGPGRGTGDQPAVDRFTMGMLTLPGSIQLAVSRAQGSPNTADDVRANKRAIAYYNNLLRMPGLTSSQKASIIDQINTYKTLNNNAGAGNIPKAGSVPTTGGGGGLGLLPAGMQAALSNAGQRAALAGGSGTAAQQLAANKALLAQQEKALNWLKAQTYTGKQLLAQKREELALAKQIEATQKRIHGGAGSPGSLAIDKILGIGSGKSVAAQLTIAGRERKIMLDFLEHLLGGRKHDIGVTAAALGITRSQLANESLAKLMKQITGTGFRFDSTTLKELRKIHEVLALARKENITLSTAQKDKITSWLQNINNTLKGQSGMGTNYRPVSIESLVNRIPGLSYAQKKLLEANLSQAQAHHFRVPTGGAAAGIALPSGVGPHSNIGAITGLPHPVPTHKHPNVRHPQSYDSGGIHVHGDIVINSSSVNADQLARELRAKLIRNSRRNATQTRGPNAGRSVGLN